MQKRYKYIEKLKNAAGPVQAPVEDHDKDEDDKASSESSDDEYEYLGGDMSLYDSALDEIDPIRTFKDTLMSIN